MPDVVPETETELASPAFRRASSPSLMKIVIARSSDGAGVGVDFLSSLPVIRMIKFPVETSLPSLTKTSKDSVTVSP